jgi:hypothetical protein
VRRLRNSMSISAFLVSNKPSYINEISSLLKLVLHASRAMPPPPEKLGSRRRKLGTRAPPPPPIFTQRAAAEFNVVVYLMLMVCADCYTLKSIKSTAERLSRAVRVDGLMIDRLEVESIVQTGDSINVNFFSLDSF